MERTITEILTDRLRRWPDESLVTLLRTRPDLVVPAPGSLAALAARAQSRISVTRALDQLDQLHLEILDAVRLTRDPDGRSGATEALALTGGDASGGDPGTVRAVLRELGDRLLLVPGPAEALSVVPAVDDVLGPYPAGLGRPAADLDPDVAAVAAAPARLRRTLMSAPPAARAVLDRLAAGPPVGTVTAGSAPTEVAWLTDHRLLVMTSPTTVELPREVGILLRRDRGTLGGLHPSPPLPARPPADQAAVDAAGAGAAVAVVGQAGTLLDTLAADPPAMRSGRLGVRELRRVARAAGCPAPVTVLLVEVAAAAGLIGEADTGDLRPATGYDRWRASDLAHRWQALATAWLHMPRLPGPDGARDSRGRALGVLAPEAERPGAPLARTAVLRMLAGLPAGTAPTGEEALSLLAWYLPRRTIGREDTLRQVLAEAATLGITGPVPPAGAALTSYGGTLLREAPGPTDLPDHGDPDEPGDPDGPDPDTAPTPAELLAPLLPPPVADVLVQADLTVVVPGPPEPDLAAELALVATPESGADGHVHRVTRDSLRRALDAGYTAEDMHGLFRRRSRTPVPQGLRYLIDDVARTHGGLRVGAAGSYLRSDDEAQVAQALADRRLTGLQLRRLAPTVLVSPASTGRLLAVLRETGYAPVSEDASGAALLVAPATRRATARARPVPPVPGPPRTPVLLGIVEDMRHGDAAARAAARAPAAVRAAGPSGGQAHAEAMAVLQQAVRAKALVWVGYVDSHGARTSRLLRPVSIGAGYLRAEDERTDTLHTFALHRITAATPFVEEGAPTRA